MEAYREYRKLRGDKLYPFDISCQSHRGPGIMAKPHYHDYIEILHCSSGLFKAQLGEQHYSFGAGDMALIHAQEIHQITGTGEDVNEYVMIKFESEILFSSEQTALELKYLLAFTLGVAAHQRIFRREDLIFSPIPQLIPQMLQEFAQKEYGYEIAIRADLCRLFLWILRQWRREGVETAAVTDVSAGDMRALQQVFDYIECNYRDKVPMEEVAALLNMSYSTFSKFFTRHTRRHFSDYLGDVRITKSKILLVTTSQSITEIALEVGFSTTSYFIQCFKAKLGVTPQHFRREFAASLA